MSLNNARISGPLGLFEVVIGGLLFTLGSLVVQNMVHVVLNATWEQSSLTDAHNVI